MMASVLLSRVLGLGREMVIAYVGGAGPLVDAYQVAFVLPEILNHVAATGFLSITFIPIFAGYLVKGREDEGWRVFSLLLTVFGLALAIAVALAVAFAPALVALVAPGLKDPAVVAAAVRMTRIVIPAQWFFFVGGLMIAVQFARERFFIPGLAPLIYNLGIITGGLVLGPRLGMEGFAWGALAGAVIGNCGLQVVGARRCGMRFAPVMDLGHPDLRRYLGLTLPLMVGLTMTFATEIFLKFFGSFLAPGGIAALTYALRVVLMLSGFGGQALGMAAYPFLARLVAENREEEMNRLLLGALRYLALVVPLAALVMVVRQEVVVILFQRGRFDAAATALCAQVLGCLLTGAVAFAAQTVVARGFYARQNTVSPALWGSAAVVASLPVFAIGVKLAGPVGLALALAVSATAQVVVLFALYCRRHGPGMAAPVLAAYGRMIAASALCGLAVGWAKDLAGLAGATFWQAVGVCAAVAVVFVPLLFLTGRLFKVEELGQAWTQLKRRLVKSDDPTLG